MALFCGVLGVQIEIRCAIFLILTVAHLSESRHGIANGVDCTTLFCDKNVLIPSVDPISHESRVLKVATVIINLGGVPGPNSERCLQNSGPSREFKAHK